MDTKTYTCPSCGKKDFKHRKSCKHKPNPWYHSFLRFMI